MKGLSKYVNDLTIELSIELLGEEYQGRLVNKMRKNEYLIKEKKHKIHFNDNLFRSLRDEREKIDFIIYNAITEVDI